MKPWFVYVVKCADGTLYTGVSDDVEKRMLAHNSGKGAKYTHGRRPVKLMWVQKLKNRSEAQKRETEIKKLTRKEKSKLNEVK